MHTKGILVVSFGTSHSEAEQNSIVAVENAIKKTHPDYKVYRAFTSIIVRKILNKRGNQICSVEEALDQMMQDGIKQVFIQPTHIIYGDEYEKILQAAARYKEKVASIQSGKPLLANTEDMKKVAKILYEEYPLEDKQALILMGHGTSHFCNSVYAAMEYVCEEQGYEKIYMGTVEAYPDIDIVIKKIKKAGMNKVIVIPFMLVAGDHAVNDMAGDSADSWKNRLRNEGFQVDSVLKGLGEYPGIRQIYCDHVNS